MEKQPLYKLPAQASTVTMSLKIVPAQPFAHGVMLYVTVPFTTPPLLRMSAIVPQAETQLFAPVTVLVCKADETKVYSKLVPDTGPVLSVKPEEAPVQIVFAGGVAMPVATGFTVTDASIAEPGQP